ncbi:MAG TPA: hypothetical protein VG299_06875 [Candidatus Dormibacteraeota bacterium]|jgi:hypothetical protein|nr:hypothetical protein [Candidatus Dormibacteraeota bacterium]
MPGLALPAGDDETAAPSLRARFEAAVAPGPSDGAAPRDAEIARTLAEAPIEGIAEVVYGSNGVFLLELDAPDPALPTQPLRAVYKPVRGERPLWDFPRRTLYLREVAAYVVDAALGLHRVPVTVLRDGPLGPGSVQRFVHVLDEALTADRATKLDSQLRAVAVLDVLINNADRKRSHLLVIDGPSVKAIDNALSFLPYPRQRTALLSLGGSPLPPRLAKRVQDLARDEVRMSALRTRLGRLLSEAEVTAFGHRVAELAEDPTFPVLDDWDGRPFEWW